MSDEEDVVHWTVYILECADNTFYTGITNDLGRRMVAHAAGKGARYTKGRGPFRLVYRETCQGRAAASRRETAIKLLSRAQKRQLCTFSSTGRMH
jgi:putative endonuclease